MSNQISGSITWQSPSNIAIVKYWGKHGNQLPRNPSLSFTLSNAHTITKVTYAVAETSLDGPQISFLFEGQPKPTFEQRIQRFINSLIPLLPWLTTTALHIESSNSFPHSSGIASSASAMSALAMCLVDIHMQINEGEWDDKSLQLASHIARLGSGSAARSLFPYASLWGKHPKIASSSDEHAIQWPIHDIFKTFHDDIMIVSAEEKSVSSTAGHQLMEGNPYASARYAQATNHVSSLIDILNAGDVVAFGELAELEALTLHGLMMSSQPPYMLLQPNTVKAIQAVQTYRHDEGIPLYFTLDAGPNLHLLYPGGFAPQVHAFEEAVLKPLCHQGRIIRDQVGQGAVRIEE